MSRRLHLEKPSIWVAGSALAAAWFSLFDAQYWVQSISSRPTDNDFRLYFMAARVGFERGWSSLYDLKVQAAIYSEHQLGPEPYGLQHHFVTPPPGAWLALPLSWLDPIAGWAVWVVLLALALLLGWRLAAPGAGWVRYTHLLVLLGLFPVAYGLRLGQDSVLVAAALAISWWLLRSDRQLAAGLVLTSIVLKPTLAFLVPIVLVARYPRAIAAFAAGAAVLAGASAISLGPGGITQFWSASTGEASLPFNWFMTLRGVLGPGWLGSLAEALVIAATLVGAWRRRIDAPPEVLMAIGIVGSVLASPYLHTQDFVVLVIAGWLFLQSKPPLWEQLWLLPGLVAVELVWLLGPLPLLVFECGWLAILLLRRPAPVPESATDKGKAAGLSPSRHLPSPGAYPPSS
jgi:hypothetical protein